jgi:hypothetical protein
MGHAVIPICQIFIIKHQYNNFKYLAKQQLHSLPPVLIDYCLALISAVPAHADCQLHQVSEAGLSALHTLPIDKQQQYFDKFSMTFCATVDTVK